MVEFYTRYKAPKSPVADSSKPSLTQQEFKESCDINNILAKFSVQARALGVEPSQLMPQDQGTYGDFSNLDDFQTAQNKIAFLNDQFSNLPSDVRRKFGDDLNTFMSALSDPNRIDELGDLGVWNKDSFLEFKRQRAQLLQQDQPQNADKTAVAEKQLVNNESSSPVNS
ncbi:MAG: internal scaffolding protein [Microviridae sp.]|nr:MAG: internal scaffolding protein [Microviridae sp.]